LKDNVQNLVLANNTLMGRVATLENEKSTLIEQVNSLMTVRNELTGASQPLYAMLKWLGSALLLGLSWVIGKILTK
jgi:hypothetical protein